MNVQGIQQNLNQISQICNQLSQNEQTNVSRLNQLSEAERTAAQQMQRCLQLVNQVSQQIQQMQTTTGTQYTSPGQMHYGVQQPYGGGQQFGIGQQQFSPGTMQGMSPGGQFSTATQFEMSREFGPGENEGDGGSAVKMQKNPSFTSGAGGQQTFNTNKDLGQ